MFYYKNKFGSQKYILQCLFIYNTIILNDMTSWIDRISNNTLQNEFTTTMEPRQCILFYQNSNNFIMSAINQHVGTSKIKIEVIKSQGNEPGYKLVETSFIQNISNKKYNYMLYISNPKSDMNYDDINDVITNNNIGDIISSKVNNK